MSKKAPKVSVLVSAYNSEKYVAEAIESILNQTFTDFEFIIVNDGSTDKTAEIIESYAKADNRIRFINYPKNQGLITVLNSAWALCNGEYIARMDSDDVALPNRLAVQVAYMDEHPECGALGTWIEKFGPSVKPGTIVKYPGKMKLLDFVIQGNRVAQPSAMVRRSVLTDHNIIYNPKYKHAEDYGFWAEISKYAEVHNLPQVLLKYRWHNSNVSVVHHKAQVECAEAIRRDILSGLIYSEVDISKVLRATKEINERFYLFGILPIIRRKQYSIVKTKYYLFDKIPLTKEKDGGIYLFEKIKIGTIK